MSGAARKELRQDVVARLKASTAVLALVPAASVYDSREIRLPREDLPAINVRTPRTKRTTIGQGPPSYEAKHTVDVYCHATADDEATLAALLDDQLEAVSAALLEDADFVAAYEAVESADESTFIHKDADGLYGVGAVSFEVSHSEVRAPDLSGADDLATVAVTVKPIEPETDEPGDAEIEVTITGLDE